MLNNFKDEDKKRVWMDAPFCCLCKSNQGCALHHIWGRKGDYSNSICNSVMLCYTHHVEADSMNGHSSQFEDYRRGLFLKTKHAIINSGYSLNKTDLLFLQQYDRQKIWEIDDSQRS